MKQKWGGNLGEIPPSMSNPRSWNARKKNPSDLDSILSNLICYKGLKLCSWLHLITFKCFVSSSIPFNLVTDSTSFPSKSLFMPTWFRVPNYGKTITSVICGCKSNVSLTMIVTRKLFNQTFLSIPVRLPLQMSAPKFTIVFRWILLEKMIQEIMMVLTNNGADMVFACLSVRVYVCKTQKKYSFG